MRSLILITRPEPGAGRFAAAVRERFGDSVDVIVSPVMEIVQTCNEIDLQGIGTLVFTSQSGVRSFAALSERRDIPCYTVGDATAHAAQEAGLHAKSAQGDVNALVRLLIADQVKGPVLHLRGAHTAGDFAADLSAVGFDARGAVIYDQQSRPLSDPARAALMGDRMTLLPLFSPRSVQLIFDSVTPTCRVIAVAMSTAVAKILPAGIKNDVVLAARPDANAMMAGIAEAVETAKRLEGIKRAQ